MIREIKKSHILLADQAGAREVVGEDAWPPKSGITGTICAATEINLKYALSFPVLKIPVSETMRTPKRIFHLAIEFYVTLGPIVLVHCRAGKNRSSATVAALLVACHGMSADQALAETNPNLPTALLTSFRSWASAWKAGGRLVRKQV